MNRGHRGDFIAASFLKHQQPLLLSTCSACIVLQRPLKRRQVSSRLKIDADSLLYQQENDLIYPPDSFPCVAELLHDGVGSAGVYIYAMYCMRAYISAHIQCAERPLAALFPSQ